MSSPGSKCLGAFALDRVVEGDASELISQLPDSSIDVVVTSPPYWGQRLSRGLGIEDDPRDYIQTLARMFQTLKAKLKDSGILWINLGDAYNTPINWRLNDRAYSTLGALRSGLPATNSAYTKPRAPRKAFVDSSEPWLRYGNLLGLPYRLILALCDAGYLFRGEVVWKKKNPMPEGRCRRPHRQHESIYLLAKTEGHSFRLTPPVKSVWEIANERIAGLIHYSRFPEDLPLQCIDAYGRRGPDVIVLDPFSGSGTTGFAARRLGCSYIGFEIDPVHVVASNQRLSDVHLDGLAKQQATLFG